MNNTFLITLDILRDLLWGVAYFPLWWYSKGLLNCIKHLFESLKNMERSWGLMIWVKNLFVPMFGVNDFFGRIVSFVMRLFQIFIRSLILFVWIFILLGALAIWLILPPLILYEIFLQLGIF